jgi:hypothetical protein
MGNDAAMNETRFDELTTKRDDVGLTDGEADELGKMMAERDGAVYENADILKGEESLSVADATQPCGHFGCGCTTSAQFCSAFCREHFDEPNDAGPAFDCGCGHDDCKAVVGEA